MWSICTYLSHMWRIRSISSHVWQIRANYSHVRQIRSNVKRICHKCEKIERICCTCEEFVRIFHICDKYVLILHFCEGLARFFFTSVIRTHDTCDKFIKKSICLTFLFWGEHSDQVSKKSDQWSWMRCYKKMFTDGQLDRQTDAGGLPDRKKSSSGLRPDELII